MKETIIRSYFGDPSRFQEDMERDVEELCNNRGYRIATISNLQVIAGSSTTYPRDSGYGPNGTYTKVCISLSQTIVYERG